MDEKKKNKLKKIVEELLELMSINAGYEVEEDNENDALIVKIDGSDETGLLIGTRGRTLNSLQTIIGMIYKKESGEWKRIIADVSGWREKEKERLESLARTTAQRAEETGEPQLLYNLTASQRRIIHLFLSQNKNIKTDSSGEGKERYLIVTSEK